MAVQLGIILQNTQEMKSPNLKSKNNKIIRFQVGLNSIKKEVLELVIKTLDHNNTLMLKQILHPTINKNHLQSSRKTHTQSILMIKQETPQPPLRIRLKIRAIIHKIRVLSVDHHNLRTLSTQS